MIGNLGYYVVDITLLILLLIILNKQLLVLKPDFSRVVGTFGITLFGKDIPGKYTVDMDVSAQGEATYQNK